MNVEVRVMVGVIVAKLIEVSVAVWVWVGVVDCEDEQNKNNASCVKLLYSKEQTEKNRMASTGGDANGVPVEQ